MSESCALCLWMAAWCNDACAMKHHVLHRCIASLYTANAMYGAAALRGTAGAGLCALRCGRRRVGSAGVWLGVGVQPEHRQLEHCVRDDAWRCVHGRRAGGLHQAQRVRQLGVDTANGLPVVELSLLSLADAEVRGSISGLAQVETLCISWLWCLHSARLRCRAQRHQARPHQGVAVLWTIGMLVA